MHEEDERRKSQEAAIQGAVRNELNIHRHKDMEHRERQTIICHYQAERRRKLMTQKQQGVREKACHDTDRLCLPQHCARKNAVIYASDYVNLGKSYSSSHHRLPVSFDPRDEAASQHRRHNSQATHQSELSSLFDTCSMDDDEELEEIALE
jgi:sensor c-di-GMP phosphodiesterase-like protein